jgi:hypothetical protein
MPLASWISSTPVSFIGPRFRCSSPSGRRNLYRPRGATIEGPQADLNLGITTYVDGTPMNPVQIDTSTVAIDTIDYVATDQNGLSSTTTRMVIVEPAQPASVNVAVSATTTAAPSSTQ